MTDILIRNIPADTLVRVDALAKRAGLSRTKYLRRMIESEAVRTDKFATMDDLNKFDQLADEEHMRGAWK